MKRNILVTGGAGLIGLEVCRVLSEHGHEVRLFDLGEQIERVRTAIPEAVKIFNGSIVDMSSLRAAMVDCEIVIHLGALLGVKRSEADKLRCIEINIDGTKNVLSCAVQSRITKIVFASSSEVYGEPLSNPVTEQSITQGKTVYAITKLAGEELCKAYAQRYSLDYTILRYFNCYGPYQTAQFVISKFIYNVIHENPPVIYGDGSQVRSYTYVSDTSRATALAALSDRANGEVFNIGTGKFHISLCDLADLVIRVINKKSSLEPIYYKDFNNADRSKSREIFERYCDSTKAEKILEWKAEIPLEEGIRRVAQKGIIFKRWENMYDEQN